MKTVTKTEALALYHKLTDLAQGYADALGTTIEKCNEPNCIRWGKFEGILDLDDGMILLLTDDDSPLFLLTEYHITGDEKTGGMMAVPENILDDAHRTDRYLTIEYKDGGMEFYKKHKNMTDVYHFHSAGNRYQDSVLISPDDMDDWLDRLDL